MFCRRKNAPKVYITPQGYTYNIYRDMIAQPHLLIAGATGSGKSTLVNALIHTALYRSPSEVQFMLLDCKGIELSDYSSLPHTIGHYITPDECIQALMYATQIMQCRFQTLQGSGCKVYNGSDIYIIIDEFADLMTTSKKTVAPLIQRLCQLGRAAKIHVILCTQCPLREIIPTAIKCNFDSRIALRTATRQDSRNIIDIAGAEQLPDPRTEHKAEMLYKHSCSISRYDMPRYENTANLIAYWMQQA